MTPRKQCFPKTVGSCTYELTAVIKLKPDKVSMERRGGYEVPSLAQELLEIDGCWRRESQFCLRV